MNALLWTSQALLALVFLFSGLNKLVLTREALVGKGQTGVTGLGTHTIRFIAVCELLGALGIIVPWWTGVAPVLTPVAAICFAVIMLLAAAAHNRLLRETGMKKERKNIGTNLVLLLLSLFVAWGRS